MNGEKAAYGSPTFSNRRLRTVDSLITRLLQDHMHEVSIGLECVSSQSSIKAANTRVEDSKPEWEWGSQSVVDKKTLKHV